MFEIFACLIVFLLAKLLEWFFKLFIYILSFCWILITLPFRLIFHIKPNHNPTKTETAPKHYSDPIEKFEDPWDDDPEDLDLDIVDMFMLDELLGDD